MPRPTEDAAPDRIVLVANDLMIGSRVRSAAARAGLPIVVVDDPTALPPAGAGDMVLVDWAARDDSWGEVLQAWLRAAGRSRLVLFGPHTDLEAHRSARELGLGPMRARSSLLQLLEGLQG